MKSQNLLLIAIFILYAQTGVAASMCLDFLEQNSNLSYVLNSDVDKAMDSFSFVERSEKLNEEIVRVTSEMDHNSKLIDRVLSKSTRNDHHKLQERLKLLNSYLENLKDIEDLIDGFSVVDKKMDVLLTNKLLASRSLRRRMGYMNQRVLESNTEQEKTFTTLVSYYLLYGEDFSFLTIPFPDWITLNIMHGRHAQGHFDYLNSAFQEVDLEARDPEQVKVLNEILARSINDLDPKEVQAYITLGVESGLVSPQGQIQKAQSWSRKKSNDSEGPMSRKNNPNDTYSGDSDLPTSIGTTIYDSDNGGGGGPSGGPY